MNTQNDKVGKSMLFDAHADILTDIYEQIKQGHTDPFIKRHLDAYQASGITHSIFVNWTNPNTGNSKDFYACFDTAIQYIQDHEDLFHLCYNLDDVFKAVESKKLGVILGVEGLKFLKDPKDIVKLYDKGIRHASLTWNDKNDYATGLSSKDGGLTKKGEAVIKKMQALGMVIDLAHANEKTFNDVFNIVKGPLVVTHGNAKSICNHQRNYTDDQLKMIQAHHGVIGVCAVASFISKNKDEQTVAHLAKHIDYMVKLIGIDHVGLGLDICYYLYENEVSSGVTGLETIKDAKNILLELKKLGYDQKSIDKIAYKNFNRVLKAVLK